MGDYISREAALKAFRLTAKNKNKDYQRGLQDAIDCLIPEVIADIPSADVQPVVHGYWEECKIRGTLTQSCSVCGNDCGVLYPYNFCPNCGARMGDE